MKQLTLRLSKAQGELSNITSARVMEKCGFRCVSEQDGKRIYALTLVELWEIEQHEAI